MGMSLEDDIKVIKGIGEKTAFSLKKLGIFTVYDLLFYFPRDYETFEIPIGIKESAFRDFASVKGTVTVRPSLRTVNGLKLISANLLGDDGLTLKAVWFNAPYLLNMLIPGHTFIFRGRIRGNGKSREMEVPQVYKPEAYEKLTKTLQPVYRLTKGITVNTIASAIKKVFEGEIGFKDELSETLRKDYGLQDIKTALYGIHFPKSREELQLSRKRFVFEEFYTFFLSMLALKTEKRNEVSEFRIRENREIRSFIEKLPFSLTEAQESTLRDIFEDFESDKVMNRLIQGDVGSGKTIVAFIAMYMTALSGYQSILMAPTEVLARQHYEKFKEFSEKYSLELSVRLLTGNLKKKEKESIYSDIASHKCDIIVGTHALIQEKAVYSDLALVITDEQHRFGVKERKALTEKGTLPHTIVMSATPIPRTLAMILYGDMDISVMKGMPLNRLPIKNAVVDISYREKAYDFITKEVKNGRQAYIICPMIDESDSSELENTSEYSDKMKKILPEDIVTGVLTGKMSSEEKEAVLNGFYMNRIQVLIATTVVEVGIDVPNATVMLIENAERFGLAELHQLRGRVGRGQYQSYCIFIDTLSTEKSRKRLEILKNSNDGFYIAAEDLKLRGPGDFFGVRQSGEMLFNIGDIYTDADILKEAREAAEKTATADFEAQRAVL